MRETVLLAVAYLSVGSVMALGQTKRSLPSEQTHFSAEDEAVKRPTAIPADVMAQLTQDSYVRQAMENGDPPLKQPPASWFSASVVHLGGADEKDLVVMAEGELRGANVVNYWVFRLLPGGAQLVLNGPAHDLMVLKSRWNGLCKIELESATAIKLHTVILRFDGNRYAIFSDKWEDIK
jgi:hypothetical protein